MSSLEELLAHQEQSMNTIHRALPNLKKLGKSKWTLAVVKNRQLQLNQAFSKAQDLDAKINLLATETHRQSIGYFVSNLFYKCEDYFNEASDFFAEIIGSLEAPSAAQSVPTVTARVTSHLPCISLPTFDGTLSSWENFRDQFQALIHNDATLSTFEKMHYLKASLTGDALRALSHLNVTEANYEIAWTILTTRFENKRRLITEHLLSLLHLPHLRNEESRSLQEMRDTINSALQALRNLNRPVDAWSDLVICLASGKFDSTTFRAWETNTKDISDYPTYSDLDSFLGTRIRILEAVSARLITPEPKSSKRIVFHTSALRSDNGNRNRTKTTLSRSIKRGCRVCDGDHLVFQCPRFLELSVAQRLEAVEQHQLCANCLSGAHFARECQSLFRCRVCRRRHHTLLHSGDRETSPPVADRSESRDSPTVISSNSVAPVASFPASVLLATARVKVFVPNGRGAVVRALLDQGSAATLISEPLARSLHLRRHRCSIRVACVSGTEATARHTTTISISSLLKGQPIYNTEAVILSSLTRYAPDALRCPSQWSHTQGLPLAEPDPFSGDPVQLIIGADLYGQVLRDGIRIGHRLEPIAQNTVFGWILSGSIPSNGESSPLPVHNVTLLENLDSQLRQFWEVEDVPRASNLTPAEQACENHFQTTHSRTDTGRCVVRLPFLSTTPPTLGDSRSRAIASFLSLERRLARDLNLGAAYTAFMDEYAALGHMTQILPEKSASRPTYYIPHHAVLRRSSSTSKLRVVFNASAATTNGQSLNDRLAIGPKLQADLSAVILRWRQFKFALTADIEKMYRQILVHSEDTAYQQILWRPSSNDPIREYQLKTVTYGTASAPFLALRVLKQLIEDEGTQFPKAIPILRHQTYVDDCIFGAEDLPTALDIRDQLISLLDRGGFKLRKWASNHSTLIQDISPDDHGLTLSKDFQSNELLHVLGLSWRPGLDVFQFRIHVPADPGRTKRQILSTISRFFDPLGWLTPVLITAKVLIQQLWSIQCDWDDEIPAATQNHWDQFYLELPLLEHIVIPRWTGFGTHLQTHELHAFADASTTAFAASVYARCVHSDGAVSTALLLAKSRVAPLRSISVPRLELCAAHLLARLVHYLSAALPSQPARVYCWTDSTIVLAWLKQTPSRWKTFVANRVSSIQTLTAAAVWRHVPTLENPADCASRGVSPADLKQHPLWWFGPEWLRKPMTEWPSQEFSGEAETVPEVRFLPSHQVSTVPPSWDLQHRFSSWSRLLRVTALIFKFVRCTRPTTTPTGLELDFRGGSAAGLVHLCDLDQAKLYWLKWIQRDVFASELDMLSSHGKVAASNELSSLDPYIDNRGVLRVGGRLRYAEISHSRKHPILLRAHPLVDKIVRHHHLLTLHGGPQLTISSLRHEYWVLRARSLVRSITHRCVQCVREKAATPSELMGDLPSFRVNRTARAFIHTGVDYAGPIAIRTTPGRGYKSHKAYIAIFICMTVKAIHLELVSNYSSAAFLAAYHRFVSRRGLPVAMYSDNGTTFQGADRELRSTHAKSLRNTDLLNTLATTHVQWHFLPPAAPHFGGLWEAGVKSVKHHLKRCIGSHTLTFEEMTTLLCRIEACLNSRPLAPVSERPDDYSALTPGHFLIGTPLIAPPEPSVLDLNEHRLNRWQLLQLLTETFWKLWSTGYLHVLQQRPKWRTIQRLSTVGRLVLIRNDNTPPSQWELGRIVECHPGNDDLTRVVTVKTSKSEYRRPIVKLCFLPLEINQAEAPEHSRAGGTRAELGRQSTT